MAITKVGSADAATNVATLPAFTAGDLALVFAFRDGSTTPPSLPAGWTDLGTGSTTSCSFRIGYRVLVGGDTTTGTWTNATEVEVLVVTGQEANDPIGAIVTNAAVSATPTWAALTLQEQGGSSWVALLGVHRSATNMNSVALTGTTNESPAQGAIADHTARGVSSWASTSKTVNASSGWGTAGIEVRAIGLHDLVSQVAAEALVLPDTQKARTSQEAVEAIVSPVSDARTSQAAVEAVVRPNNLGRVSQLAVEALVLQLTTAERLSQIAAEAVILPTGQKARTSQVVAEVLKVAQYDHPRVIWHEEQ